jgi:hypothetical protein
MNYAAAEVDETLCNCCSVGVQPILGAEYAGNGKTSAVQACTEREFAIVNLDLDIVTKRDILASRRLAR